MSVEAPTVAALTLGSGPQSFEFGITRATFLERYFEKNFMLTRGALHDRIAWSDIDALLHVTDPTPPYFKMFKDGELPLEDFADTGISPSRLDKSKFHECLRGGATAVVNRIELSWLTAQRLCNGVGRFCGQPTIGNAYLTFGGSGTFGKHWDTHDVFAVQMLGKKRWRVYKPSWPLPLSHHTSKGRLEDCPVQPVLDTVLHEGDVLYLPRGWWHEAIPCEGGSFHLSVGTYAPTVLDFVQWTCARLESELAARVGLTGDPHQSIDVDGIMKTLQAALSNSQTRAAYHDSLADRERTRGEFDLHSLFTGGDALPDATVINLTSRYAPRFDGPNLLFNGSQLRLEPLRRALVQLLSESRSLRAIHAAIPQVPRPSICAAILDLAQHNIVEIHRP